MAKAKKPQPTAYTAEEVREQLLKGMRGLAEYWSSPERSATGHKTTATEKDRMEGLCFSILNLFDGTTMALPAFDIVCRPHPDDKAYCVKEGERWYEDGQVINDGVELHEEFFK